MLAIPTHLADALGSSRRRPISRVVSFGSEAGSSESSKYFPLGDSGPPICALTRTRPSGRRLRATWTTAPSSSWRRSVFARRRASSMTASSFWQVRRQGRTGPKSFARLSIFPDQLVRDHKLVEDPEPGRFRFAADVVLSCWGAMPAARRSRSCAARINPIGCGGR